MTDEAPYRNPDLPVDERAEDLLGRMTLEEKIGQLTQLHVRDVNAGVVREQHLGSVLFAIGEPTIEMQKVALEGRLGIPIIFGIDAIHGHAFWPGATVFPTQLALSNSWEPDLVEEVGRITALEAALTGCHWTFSPVCGTVRDLRWGRVDETFGEDPYLIGVLAAALVRGYQGDEPADPERIRACAKHYAGYCATRGGRDAAEADITRRLLLSTFLPPFRAACEAGCDTYMTAYQAIDGVPCTANRWLMTEVLREEWGFDGFVVTDWDNCGHMINAQHVCSTLEEAAAVALEAGNDMMMGNPAFYEAALRAARAGRIPEEQIDRACRRVLRMKLRIGLFEREPSADMERAAKVVGCAEHRAHALKAACASIVLLKNRSGLLPLPEDAGTIAVIGPNADHTHAQLGDWSKGTTDSAPGEHPREAVSTVLDGIRERAGGEVEYVRGCDVRDGDDEEIDAAVEAARRADVVVCVLGDDTSLNGEHRDRATLDLTGAQQRLLEAVHAAGTPLVLVLIHGKPLTIPWAAEHVSSIIAAFNPGMEGGRAVAALLFGDRNPSGKLTVSWPRHVAQQPVYYNQVPGWHTNKYADMRACPLFPFGHGLSYTSYQYCELRLAADRLGPGEPLVAEVDVQNTGERAGAEIVQLYVNDLVSSVTTPLKELKAFARVELEPGERRTVRLEVPYERLSLVRPSLERVVEPGEFEVMVGPSSRDDDLLRARFGVTA